MKKIFFLMYLLLISTYVISQNYVKTVEVGKEYRILANQGMGSTVNLYYHISCDTMIGDQTYYKIDSEYYTNSYGLVREDTIEQKVYYWAKDSIYETLVLDYKLEAGDTFVFGYSEFEMEVDTVYYTDDGRKVIDFGDYPQFIEGFGNIFKGVITHSTPHFQLAGINDTLNICGITAIDEINKINTEIKIFPNPTNDIIHLITVNRNHSQSYRLIESNGLERARGYFTGKLELNLGHLENGIYYIEVTNENHKSCKPIYISK